MSRWSKLVLAAFAISACDSNLPDDSEDVKSQHAPPATDEIRGPENPDESEAIIAEYAVGERGIIRFIDESVTAPNGAVGMLAVNVPHFSKTVKELGLSPLEVFLAVAPNDPVPDILREHHQHVAEFQGRESLEPRKYSVGGHAMLDELKSPLRPIFQETGTLTDCVYGGGDGDSWAHAYCPRIQNFGGGYDSCTVDHSDSGNQTNTTGDAAERWLGACVYNTSDGVLWGVYTFSGVWIQVLGTALTLDEDDWVEYHSGPGSTANYRSIITASATEFFQWGWAID